MKEKENLRAVEELKSPFTIESKSEPRHEGSENQDAYFAYAKKDVLICGVFDGVGGLINGKEAAQKARDLTRNRLEELFQGKLSAKKVMGVLGKTLVEINPLVREVGGQTTATIAVVWKEKKSPWDSAKWRVDGATVGDSPAFVYGGSFKEKKLVKITKDDRVILNKISQALGGSEVKPRPFSEYISPEGRFVLTTDGIPDNISENEIDRSLRIPSTPLALEDLFKKAKETPDNPSAHPDDMTVVIISLSDLEKVKKPVLTVDPKIAGPVAAPGRSKKRERPADLDKKVRTVVRSRKPDEGRRRVLAGAIAVLGVAAFGGVAYLASKDVKLNPEGPNWIENDYGKFLPIYGEVGQSDIPNNLDFFFRQKPLTPEMFKMNPADLLIDSQIPDKVLEKLAQQGTKIVFGDVDVSDYNLRAAAIVEKAFIAADEIIQKERRKPQIAVNVSPDFTGVEKDLKFGVIYARSIMTSNENYGAGLLNSLISEVGGRINFCTSRVIVLPGDFKFKDLSDPQRRAFIKVDNKVDDFLSRKLKERGISDPLDK